MKLSQKQIEKAMKRMGIKADEINAEEVIIKTPEKEIIISNPQVARVNMMGQDTWQITGDAAEKPRQPFSEDDIHAVVNQTGASRDEVAEALKMTHGDLAQAILRLRKKRE